MIQSRDLQKVMDFVANRWASESKDPNSRLMSDLPNDFWMNSVGGKTANGGFWVTTLMYTENEADAAAFREVLLRWQSRGNNKNGASAAHAGGPSGGYGGSEGPDLIQISRMRQADSKGADAGSDNGSSRVGSSTNGSGASAHDTDTKNDASPPPLPPSTSPSSSSPSPLPPSTSGMQ